MNTQERLFFNSNYKAIESEIINGADKVSHLTDKSESSRRLFHQQIEGLDSSIVLGYIEYIRKQDIKDFWKREGLTQLKSYLQSIESKINLSTSPPPEQTPPPKPPLYFTRSFTPEQLKQLYTGLTNGEYLPKDPTGVDFKAFCYVFGGNGKQEDFKSLEWKKKKNHCAYLIDQLFGNGDDNFWDIGEKSFNIKGLRQLKNNYLGNKNDNGKPKGHDKIDIVIKDI